MRLLKSIPWGFPRQTRDMRREGEPPGRIGLVADLTNPLWDRIVVDPRYRCLIPLTHFANIRGRYWGYRIACVDADDGGKKERRKQLRV
ncbi:hypothetical protein [Rhizobium laguerreae]|uniref:hypothetical protein n=1 Tax=Rhizobium laguerreae TaxID=1076926 RepID=UPI001FE97DA4|nr:hypothetical protein [Rhizobium laguerreae]